MTTAARVSSIEQQLLATIQRERDPYNALLVMQLAKIARDALTSAEAAWRRHDKRSATPSGQRSLFDGLAEIVRADNR
jgi:hypothetical protein